MKLLTQSLKYWHIKQVKYKRDERHYICKLARAKMRLFSCWGLRLSRQTPCSSGLKFFDLLRNEPRISAVGFYKMKRMIKIQTESEIVDENSPKYLTTEIEVYCLHIIYEK